MEADAGHQKNFEIGSYDATGYMEELFKKTSRETNWLSAGKLILMAERYAGTGVLLPGRPDTDDTAFGSLAAVREEILEELSDYAQITGMSLKRRSVKQKAEGRIRPER